MVWWFTKKKCLHEWIELGIGTKCDPFSCWKVIHLYCPRCEKEETVGYETGKLRLRKTEINRERGMYDS